MGWLLFVLMSLVALRYARNVVLLKERLKTTTESANQALRRFDRRAVDAEDHAKQLEEVIWLTNLNVNDLMAIGQQMRQYVMELEAELKRISRLN